MAFPSKSAHESNKSLYRGRDGRNLSGITEAEKYATAIDNTGQLLAQKASKSDYNQVFASDASDFISITGGHRQQRLMPIFYRAAANGDIVTKRIYFNPRSTPMRVEGFQEIHATAGNHASAVTMDLVKDTAGTAAGTGVSLLSSTVNLKGTANTLQAPALTTTIDRRVLTTGQSLTVKITGNTATAAGVLAVVWLSGAVGVQDIVMDPVTDLAAGPNFFIANRPCIISGIKLIYGTAGTDSSAVTMQVEKCTGTTAAGSGTELLTSTGFNLKSTADVIQTGTLSATAASLRMAAGDRLALDVAGTTTAWATPLLIVTISSLENRLEVPINVAAAAGMVDQALFIANATFELLDARWTQGGTPGSGTINLQVTHDIGTAAPGAGLDLLTDDSAAGFATEAAADTVQVGTLLTDIGKRVMLSGDRLSLDFAGTQTSVTDGCCTVSLRYA